MENQFLRLPLCFNMTVEETCEPALHHCKNRFISLLVVILQTNQSKSMIIQLCCALMSNYVWIELSLNLLQRLVGLTVERTWLTSQPLRGALYHCVSFWNLLQTILVGDSGVGKTSLLVQFDQGKFQSGSFSATVGIGFTVKHFGISSQNSVVWWWVRKQARTRLQRT